MLSNNPDFKELLLLHGRDRRLVKLLHELEALPEDIEKVDSRISTEKDSIEIAVSEWKQLESQNNTLEKEIIELEERISKSKVRQLEAKKNEEYQALENEIQSLTELNSSKEDEQIDILVKIDGAQEVAKIAQDKIVKKVKDLEVQKLKFEDRITEIKSEVKNLEDEIKDAVENLPTQYREVVLLADVQGFSYKEIAEILEVPDGTVMSRLHRGRAKLQKDLLEFASKRGLLVGSSQMNSSEELLPEVVGVGSRS